MRTKNQKKKQEKTEAPGTFQLNLKVKPDGQVGASYRLGDVTGRQFVELMVAVRDVCFRIAVDIQKEQNDACPTGDAGTKMMIELLRRIYTAKKQLPKA